jgi:hypothetical protein
MAIVTQDMMTSNEASVSVTYNDANGAIQSIQWTILSGTLVVTIYKSGQPPLVRTVTTSGSMNVPNGYNLTKGPKGDWKWLGDPAFEIQWTKG